MTSVAMIGTQIDKVVLTRMVALEAFGYYSLAMTIAAAVTIFGQPVHTAIYPAMIEAFTSGDRPRLGRIFHRSAQLVSVCTFAPAAVMCAFSPLVLRLWSEIPLSSRTLRRS
jgi:O-antigen/teichoic acid export membrane protein